MAIANSTAGVWVNNDGLRVKFPPALVIKGIGGEYNEMSSTHTSEFDIDFATLALGTSDTNVYIIDYDSVFPNGAVIEKVVWKVGTAWDSAGSAATLNVGLVGRAETPDGPTSFTTIVDADGIVAALAESVIDTTGAIVEIDKEGNATYAGALLGTALTRDVVLSMNWNGAVPTVGTALMYVYWRFSLSGIQAPSP